MLGESAGERRIQRGECHGYPVIVVEESRLQSGSLNNPNAAKSPLLAET
jgi:hypothetical protein